MMPLAFTISQETPLTYENLTTCSNDEIWLNNCNEELLKYMQYFLNFKN